MKNEKKLTEETKTARQELIDGGADEEAVDAYIALGAEDRDLSGFEEAYRGKYTSDVEFAQQYHADLKGEETQNWPYTCIDWEWAARELMMDYSEQDGHYFLNL